MSILVATDLGEIELTEWLKCLHEAMPGETLITDRLGWDAQDIDIAIVANPSEGSLQGLSSLRLIQSLWAGVDKLLGDITLPPEVPLARMVDPAMNQAMAQTALWAVLGIHRGFFRYAQQQSAKEWKQLPQCRADEVTVAMLGLGEMGRTVAQRLATNGYCVIGWSRKPAQVPGVESRHGDSALGPVLAQANIVLNLLPLTGETRGIFDRKRFVQMRRGASIVNLARGAHVVDADLLEALGTGQIEHAVLDVFHAEPLPCGHAFWTHPQVTVLPHVAALTDPRSASAVVAKNVRALRRGLPLQHLVDRSKGY
ncbi:MAG: glyoxylate/hydroxypyruvate reductase A [Burkholderiales bacterium]|jgi:glyoxylate/hydroxypyruvate reductase|nr:glyoxylate/hydroxypyruvate reductase A [Burkholderiales bacterium]